MHMPLALSTLKNMGFLALVWTIMLPCLCQPQPATEPPDNSGANHPKCTYTFVVAQQKMTGAICVSTASFPVALGVNRSEVQELREELSRQQIEIVELKKLVEVDHELTKEMEHLRKESRNTGSRLSHLHTQLLHEILQRKNESTEVLQVEDRTLNVTSEVHSLASKYRDLQEKYNFLASLVNNQSLTIARLEEQCLQSFVERQIDHNPAHPPLVGTPPNWSPDALTKHVSEIQGDKTEATQEPDSVTTATPNIPVAMATEVTESSGPWLDCFDALLGGQKSSGIYLLKPHGGNQVMQAWCDQERAGGGWTIIQRRQDGSINFFTTWQSYKHGFGNLDGEYWLGLENIYWLTDQGSYKLLVLMEDWQGRYVTAEYDNFRLEPESDFYRLRLGRYHGNAGDSLSWHNDKQFSTLDKDRDSYPGNCAHFQKGGWWYNMCAHSNLNGMWYKGGHYRSRYQDGVYWAEFRGGAYSLKKVSMMIKPNK
ncbi:hypothetical protein FKM82_021209 [Ascaphus truei]